MPILRFPRPLPFFSALLAATLATACWAPQPFRPGPLVLERPARAIPVEACEPSAERGAPTGHTPPPVADGELAILDVRGDDRLVFTGSFLATWSSDGERLVTADEKGVLLWTVRTGDLERRLDLGARPLQLRHIVISPDDAWIAVSGDSPRPWGSPEPCTWLLRANGDAPARRFAGIGGDLRFTADSLRLLANGHAWDLATGTLATTPALEEDALFLPDGLRVLVFAGTAPSPHRRVAPELRDLATGATIHRFPEVESSIRVALSGDGQRVAILDDALSVYSTSTFERVALIRDVERTSMVHLSHDGRRAVLETPTCPISLSHGRSEDECPPPVVAVWDLDRAGRLLRTDRGAGAGWLFSRDGAYLTGSGTVLNEEAIRVKDGVTLRFGWRIRAISPDSRWVLFDGVLGLDVASLDGSTAPPALRRAPRVLTRSTDGHLVANLDGEGRLRIEGPGSCLRLGLVASRFAYPESPYDHFELDLDQVIFSPDAASLFTVTQTTAGHNLFRAFRTSDGAERWSVHAADRSGDGARVYVLPSAGQVIFQGSERFELLRFDATTGAALPAGRAPAIRYRYHASLDGSWLFAVRDLGGDSPSTLVNPAATRDGRSLATYGHLNEASRLSIWDPLDPRRVVDFPVAGEPSRLALSPDERLWAAGLVDGKISIFSRDGRPIVDAAPARAGRITAMIFTKSGDRLAAATDDGAVLLVDTSNGAVVGRARLPFDRATHLWLSPDEHELWVDTERAMRVRFRIAR